MPAPARAKEAPIETLSLKERIRRRAHELYIQRGRQSDSELDDWLQAEKEIRRAEEAIDEASDQFPVRCSLTACGVTPQIQRWQVGPRWDREILVGRSGRREVLLNDAEFASKTLLDQRMTKISRLGRLRSSRGVPAPKVCRKIRLKLNTPT